MEAYNSMLSASLSKMITLPNI